MSERVDFTYSVLISPLTVFCSVRVSASRRAHLAARAMISSASVSAFIHSCSHTNLSRFMISVIPIFLKSKRSERERMVSGTLSISVVARMNFT